MQDEDGLPGGYASAWLSVAILSGFFALVAAAACLSSAYRETLEPPFICDAYNCVGDSRACFERHLGLWSLDLGLATVCVVSTAINRRRVNRS